MNTAKNDCCSQFCDIIGVYTATDIVHISSRLRKTKVLLYGCRVYTSSVAWKGIRNELGYRP